MITQLKNSTGRMGPRSIWFQYLWPFRKTILSKCVCVCVCVCVCTHAHACCTCSVAGSCLTLCDPMDCSFARLLCSWDFPGNTGVDCHFRLQGSFQPMDQAHVFCIGRRIFYHWATVPCCLTHGLNYNMWSTETMGAPRNSSAIIL